MSPGAIPLFPGRLFKVLTFLAAVLASKGKDRRIRFDEDSRTDPRQGESSCSFTTSPLQRVISPAQEHGPYAGPE
jgi:hypothetical protein